MHSRYYDLIWPVNELQTYSGGPVRVTLHLGEDQITWFPIPSHFCSWRRKDERRWGEDTCSAPPPDPPHHHHHQHHHHHHHHHLHLVTSFNTTDAAEQTHSVSPGSHWNKHTHTHRQTHTELTIVTKKRTQPPHTHTSPTAVRSNTNLNNNF